MSEILMKTGLGVVKLAFVEKNSPTVSLPICLGVFVDPNDECSWRAGKVLVRSIAQGVEGERGSVAWTGASTRYRTTLQRPKFTLTLFC